MLNLQYRVFSRRRIFVSDAGIFCTDSKMSVVGHAEHSGWVPRDFCDELIQGKSAIANYANPEVTVTLRGDRPPSVDMALMMNFLFSSFRVARRIAALGTFIGKFVYAFVRVPVLSQL